MIKSIFIDESGNCDLDSGKKGDSSLFVIIAIIIDSEKRHDYELKARDIIKKYVGDGELKSSRIGNNHHRRIMILNDFMEINYKIYGLIVDKNLISRETGLQFKRSFIKYINGIVCEKIFKTFKNVEILGDGTGNAEFQKGMRKYIIKKKSESILIDDSSYEMADSKSNPLLQLADLVAGTVVKLQNKKIEELNQRELFESIKNKILILDHWPPYKRSIVSDNLQNEVNDANYFNDEIIKRYSIDSAINYINDNPPFGDKEIEIRLCTLRFLLYQISDTGKNAFVYSNEIINHIKEMLGYRINHHALSSRIISKLRDDGVVISSGDKGYKIPCTLLDVVEYIKSTDEKVIPMIQRINKTSKAILLASSGKINLIDDNASERLKSIIKFL